MPSEWRVSKRISYITEMLKNINIDEIILRIYRPGPDSLTGWYRVEASKEQYRVFITEFISKGSIRKYSYILLKENRPILRYDNAPHYPGIETHPHHKHVENKVEPLQNPSIEDFLRETKDILEAK